MLILDLKLKGGGDHHDALRMLREIERCDPSLLNGRDLVIWTSYFEGARSDRLLQNKLTSLFKHGVSSIRFHKKPVFPTLPLLDTAFPGVVNFFDATTKKYTP